MKSWQKITILFLGILGIHLFLLTQFKFTAWPEMLLWPYLSIHNLLPYRDIAIVHTPLLIGILAAVYKIFGVGILQLKIFTWILILGIDCFLFLIAKKLWNYKVALITVSSFVLWQLFFDGNGLWFDLFMTASVLASFYFVEKKRYFWVGIFWALAFISKQTAIYFLLPIGISIISNILRRPLKGDPRKVIMDFIFGVFIIFGMTLLLLFAFHLLPSFYNWAIKFGIFILPKAEGQVQLPDLKGLMMAVLPFTIFIPLIWKTGKKNINLLLWTIVGGLGAYPRFEYFHFQPAIPFLAIATGLMFTNLSKKNILLKIFIPIYIFGSLILFAGYFLRNWREDTRFFEQNVQDVVSFVKYDTKQGDRVFVMNWWENIYALTDTIPATDPLVPQLSWYQTLPGIQDRELTNLKNSKPKLILLQDYADSGLAAYIPQKVYNYVMANYRLKQKVDGIEVLIPKK